MLTGPSVKNSLTPLLLREELLKLPLFREGKVSKLASIFAPTSKRDKVSVLLTGAMCLYLPEGEN